jgi:hypothetical protein
MGQNMYPYTVLSGRICDGYPNLQVKLPSLAKEARRSGAKPEFEFEGVNQIEGGY